MKKVVSAIMLVFTILLTANVFTSCKSCSDEKESETIMVDGINPMVFWYDTYELVMQEDSTAIMYWCSAHIDTTFDAVNAEDGVFVKRADILFQRGKKVYWYYRNYGDSVINCDTASGIWYGCMPITPDSILIPFDSAVYKAVTNDSVKLPHSNVVVVREILAQPYYGYPDYIYGTDEDHFIQDGKTGNPSDRDSVSELNVSLEGTMK